jgi:hypothetical protein
MRILLKNSRFEVREYPPTRRTIKVQEKTGFFLYSYKTFSLSFPFQIFALNRGCLFYVAFSTTSVDLQNWDHNLIFPPLPNVFENCCVCMPAVRSTNIEEYITSFWQSSFCNDSPWTGLANLKRQVRPFWRQTYSDSQCFEKWQKMSPQKVTKMFNAMRKMSSLDFDNKPITYRSFLHAIGANK